MNEMNEMNRQLLKDLIQLLPKDMHSFGQQLMSAEIVCEPIVDLRQTLEDYVTNELIAAMDSMEIKTGEEYEDNDNVCEEMCAKCETILDKMWETINCCDWSQVLIDFRHCFAYISLIKALIIIWSLIRNRSTADSVAHCVQQRQLALKQLDFGLLMSPKLTDNNILAKFATIIHKSIANCIELNVNNIEINLNNIQNSVKRNSSDNEFNSNTKRLNKNDLNRVVFEDRVETDCPLNANECRSQTITDNSINGQNLQSIIPYFKNRVENRIKRVNNLDFIEFIDKYLRPKIPVIITDCMNDWPAMTDHKWTVDYILKVAAYRTVPIEIGSKYTDEDWTQKLMTVKEFISDYIISGDGVGRDSGLGYLAQHNLFDQLEELNADFSVPDYCSITDEDCVDVDINAWFGPKGTVSPLHYDPKDNLLAQVLGQKYVRLYSDRTPAEAIYPNDSRLLFNTSRVDLENINRLEFPDFEKVDNYFECVLNEGEMLYIPKKYWHFVKSLSTSFSLSFWWK